ncbi:hypothetical protein [Pseudomonas sp.]|uniref:hypothetical protein n=1 Tax=Pseudomonas sp. TaxID=306 RepID=UPI003982753A
MKHFHKLADRFSIGSVVIASPASRSAEYANRSNDSHEPSYRGTNHHGEAVLRERDQTKGIPPLAGTL